MCAAAVGLSGIRAIGTSGRDVWTDWKNTVKLSQSVSGCKLQGSHVAYAGSGTDQVISRVDRASAVNGPKVRAFKDIKGKSIAEN